MAATALPPFDEISFARFLVDASDAQNVGVGGIELLPGGAIQQNWGVHAEFIGGPPGGDHDLVLPPEAPTGVPSSLGPLEEIAALRAVFAAGAGAAGRRVGFLRAAALRR